MFFFHVCFLYWKLILCFSVVLHKVLMEWVSTWNTWIFSSGEVQNIQAWNWYGSMIRTIWGFRRLLTIDRRILYAIVRSLIPLLFLYSCLSCGNATPSLWHLLFDRSVDGMWWQFCKDIIWNCIIDCAHPWSCTSSRLPHCPEGAYQGLHR